MTIQQHASFDSSAAELNATSKLVKAWESKNAKNAAKAGGISLMALSLAACGGSSTTPESGGGSGSGSGSDSSPDVTPLAFTLTAGTNAFTGTTAADTFDAGLTSAGVQTLQGSDVLNGGAGVDTLTAVLTGSVTPNMTAVEVVNVSTSAVATLDLLASSGVTTISNSGSTALLTVQNIGSSVESMTLGNTTAGGTFTFLASTVTGTADAKTFTVSNVGAGTLTVDNAIEEVTINSAGTANTLTAISSAADTINFTGSSALSVTGVLATAETIDGSAATGGLTFENSNTAAATISTGSGNDTVTMDGAVGTVVDTVSLGAGNDTIVYQAAGDLDKTDALTGGDGTDTISALVADLDTTNFDTASTTITGFEAITVSNALANTITLANIQATGLDTVGLAAGGTGAINFGAGAKVINLAAPLTGALTVDASGTATTDSLAVNNTDVAANSLAGQNIVSTDFETITVSTSGTGANTAQTIGAVTMTASVGGTTTLNFSGTNEIATGVLTANVIDASGMTAQTTKTPTFTMNSAGVGVTTITGSDGDDTLRGDAASTINGGAGIDTIIGGTGNDTLNGGAGNDTITTNTGNDTVDGGAGDDVVNMDGNLTGDDTVAGGDGTDTIAIDAAATAITAAGVSSFEVLRFDTAALDQNMVNFTANTTFAKLVNNVAGANSVTNVSNTVTDLTALNGTTTLAFDRLVDGATNALTFGAATDVATSITTLTANDEETLTIDDGAIDSALNLVIGTLNAEDLVTLNITGVANVEITGAIAAQTVATLTTVNAATNTGTVDVDASNATLALTMTGSATAASILAGGSKGDAITGGAGNDTLTGNGGTDTIVGGAGTDGINGGTGNDTLTGGEGTDTITGAAGSDSIILTETQSVADVVVINAVEGTSSDSGRTTVTGDNNDTGADTVTGFAFGTDTISVVATEVAVFDHTTDTFIGTATGDVNDGTVGSFLGTVGLVDLDGSGAIGTGDVAITFASPSATMTEALFDAAVVYDLTAQAGGSTIVGGAGADTITGGAGADTITGGLGADTLSGVAGGADDFVMVLADAGDTITGFTTGTDDFDFNGTILSIDGLVTTVAGTAMQSGAANTVIANDTTVFELTGVTTAGAAADLVTALGTSATNASIDAGDTFLIVNYTAGGDAQVWNFTDASGADVDAGELTLLATLDTITADALVAADFI